MNVRRTFALAACTTLLWTTAASAQSDQAPVETESESETETSETSTDDDPADQRAHELSVFGEVYATYAYEQTDANDFNEFRLDRGFLGASWTFDETAGLLVELEGIRSAGPGSTTGIDQNSIAARIRHAYGFYDQEVGPGSIEVQAGLIPDVWTATLLSEYDLRAMSPIASQQRGFFFRSDLGGRIAWSSWERLLELRLSLTNGEGRNRQERNAGKNAMFQISSFPLRADVMGEELSLGVHAIYRDGSFGVSSARNHRIAAASTLSHPRFGAGLEYVHALGLAERASVEANTAGLWLRGEPVEQWLGLAARADRTQFDLDEADATLLEIRGGAYSTIAVDASGSRVRAYLYYVNQTYGDAAGPVPGTDAGDSQSVILTVEATGKHTTN
jgi:opacity protein-like surface antigen